ncbi:hypothetical protein J4404_01155 [Candidatus Woesearchaeota archaeon]|nr:hypothetical protein [Candidatus Woesearchaeota archaeon]
MDKRAMSMTVLVTLIVLLAGAVVLMFATSSISGVIKSSSDKEACKQSVLLNSQKLTSILNIPLKCKSQDQTIKNENDLKNAKEIIAKGMYNCWNQFGEGKLDFMGEDSGVFCFICNKIGFDDSLKGKNIIGLGQYLKEEQVPLLGKTYAEYLNWENDLNEINNIPIDNPLYIFYVFDTTNYLFMRPMGVKTTLGNFAYGCIGGAAVGVWAFGVGALPACAVGAGLYGGGRIGFNVANKDKIKFEPSLLIAWGPEDVVNICKGSQSPFKSLVAQQTNQWWDLWDTYVKSN